MNSMHPPPEPMPMAAPSVYPPHPSPLPPPLISPGSGPTNGSVFGPFSHHRQPHPLPTPPRHHSQSGPHDMQQQQQQQQQLHAAPHSSSHTRPLPPPSSLPPPATAPSPAHAHPHPSPHQHPHPLLPHQHHHQHSASVSHSLQLQHPAMMPPPPKPDEPSSSVSHAVSQDMLIPFAKVDDSTGRKYQLDVVQQPRRARMCGFGDKDRRPITPPPCVRLIITDATTGHEIDCNAIDHSMFVLNVDLWNEDGTREVNLVRSSTGSPSISSTTPYSYTTLNGGDPSMIPYHPHVLASHRDPAYNASPHVGYISDYQMQQGFNQPHPSYPPNGSYGPPQQFFPQHQGYRHDGTLPPVPSQAGMAHFTRNGVPVAPGFVQDQGSLTRMAMVGGQPQGMFTRNLIGSLAASAFRLSDTSDHIGIWFVLQDLSVRTEGSFRLRFSFVNVGARGGARRDGNSSRVNTGRAPILASCFSDVFNVYSAKKFPGVCESTPLSKTFATQGIKIPIRKDANVKGGDEDDYVD
ncbi:hypothetical protein CDD81_5551 [Ophiocordyceps australis]|uniref:Velvet domain-containing protein n=1 Tax=Ophiocordyceps australis TaxID=1399860 RepID=A0A2C5X9Z3_9HYPO|nr:hypothetical protein CDD81_5551 [Ophiocordyceps australis]